MNPQGGAVALSVVVVSRHRPAELALCLGALALQDHAALEVVLVADPGGLSIRTDLPLKRVGFDEPNISAARNAGIAAAAGEVVAFIDDDAVAEPTWASRLAGAFQEPQVIGATGWTLGPWGRRWQVRAEAITPHGPVPLPVAGEATRLYKPSEGTILSTLGTNCAFRRDALVAVGGFDPAFAWHLDESDLNLRLAVAFPQAATALVPLARVVHGSAPSERRNAARVPRDLVQIGRSEAIYAGRHGGDARRAVAVQRRRLLRQMLAGRLDPLRVERLLRTLRDGITAGEAMRPPAPAPMRGVTAPPFLPLPTRTRPHRLIAGWAWQRHRLRREAAAGVKQGDVVTLLLLVPGTMPHRQRFHPRGWWEHSGGVMGPSAPGDPPLWPVSYAERVRLECVKIELLRSPARHETVASATKSAEG